MDVFIFPRVNIKKERKKAVKEILETNSQQTLVFAVWIIGQDIVTPRPTANMFFDTKQGLLCITGKNY